ncbi:MAG: phosphoribosyl-ATP diphosphatase [Pseudomonadota bacterium]
MTTDTLGEVLSRLYAVIESRRGDDPKSSYTASLLTAGGERCAKKFGEEAVETVIAGAAGDKSALREEAADALFHLLVLLASRGVTPDEVASVLASREGVSGHAEKASREK